MILLWAGFSILLCNVSCEGVKVSQRRQMGSVRNQLSSINESAIFFFLSGLLSVVFSMRWRREVVGKKRDDT